MEFVPEQSQAVESTPSPEVSQAVESIQAEAPKLSGLDKLRAAKEHVERTGELPSADKTAIRGADGKFQSKVPVAPATGTPVVAPPEQVSNPDGSIETPYTADFKYKAQGKEFEIPEKFRALITDKASEEELKTLFGKANTVDEYKGQIDTFKKNLGEVGGQLNQMQGGVQQLRNFVQKGDFDGFFKGINIPPEKVYQWVLDKVNYNQLPPEQKAQLDQQRNLQAQAEAAQTQVSHASHREMELATQVKGMQLDQTLGKAEVKSMADAFDARVGRPGAFKDAIIDHGKSIWALSNFTKDLTPEEAVQSFIQRYGNPAAGSQTTQAPAAEAAAPAPSANAAPPVKVIPNVASRNSSPVKTRVKTLDDIKKIRDEMVQADNSNRSPSQGYLAG